MTEGSPYRSRCRIYFDILRAVAEAEKARTAYLIHQANLSYDRLVSHLGKMEGLGLIERKMEGEVPNFIITPKGRKYLAEFRKVEEFGDTFGIIV